MKHKNFTFLIFLFILPTIVATINTNIDVKDTFYPGEKIIYSYSLLSDENIDIIVIPHIWCPSAPLPFMIEKKVELKSAPEQIIVRIEPLRKEEAEPAPADTAEEQVAEEEEIEKTEKRPKDGEEKEALVESDKAASEPKKP